MAGDRSCVLYNWYVAQRWKGDTSGTTYSACYSAWADRGDVVKISYPTNAYTTISSGYSPNKVVDGVSYCDGCNSYLSNTATNNYWYVYLQAYVKVKKIILVIARVNYFRSIILYVGNSTSYTSSTMEQVYNFGSVAVSYKENVAVINPPVVGCYVLIRSAHTSVNMELCEIQIIKA